MDRKFYAKSSPDKALGGASPFLHRNTSKLSLNFFNLGRGDNWHRQVSTIAANHFPVTLDNHINPLYPWEQLREHTNLFLERKGSLTLEQKDDILTSLVRKHDAKHVVLAACGPYLSTQTLMQLLRNELLISAQKSDRNDLTSYLKMILIASHVNSGISAWEVQSARLLLSAGGTSPVQSLVASIQVLLAGLPTEGLLYLHVFKLAQKALVIFVADLKLLEINYKWTTALSAVKWLSMFASNVVPNEVLALLHDVFPSWRAWALWKPDMKRIVSWDLFTHVQRATLGKILTLEGPDFLHSSDSTLREAVSRQGLQRPTHIPRVSSLFELKGVPLDQIEASVERLLNVIDVVYTNCPYNTHILAYFCVGQTITNTSLELLECLNSVADASISLAVAQIFKTRNESEHIRGLAAMQLLPFLTTGRGQNLRVICAPHISMVVNKELSRRKKEVENQLQPHQPGTRNPSWTGAEMKLQSYVASLMRAQWLLPLIKYDGLLNLLEEWPSADDLKNLHSIRMIASQRSAAGHPAALLAMIDGYYLDCLVHRGTINDEVRGIVKSLIILWTKTLGLDRRNLALLVAQGHNTTTADWCQIISQIPDLHIDIVIRFYAILTTYSKSGDAACVDLVALLGNSQTPELVYCWRPVLYYMAADRGSKLVDFALTNLEADKWIGLLRNLRMALGGQFLMYDDTTTSILSIDLHKWAICLSTHLSTITVLEKAITLGTARRCLMLGGDQHLQQILEQILRILSFDMNSQNQQAMYAVVSHLQAAGENASEVLDVLNALICASMSGVAACLHLMDFYQNNSSEVAEVMLAGWLQASDLNQFDEKALECMAVLLGGRAGIRSGWSDDSLNIVAEYLDTQYANILHEAQRLDVMRIALKAIDPIGTSKLLAEINVEDISEVELALSYLPPELVSVVEKVGEREVEMLFPLTHLTQLQRNAIGVDNAQSVLLRLMVGGDGMPPGFCIHLDTELDERNNDTSYFSFHKASVGIHSPWMAFEDGGYPYQPICHGKEIPAKFQLARLLHRHLVDGFKSLTAIHTLITSALKGMGKLCITCGSTNGVNLRRATVCKSVGCNSAIQQASLDVRLSDIRSDPLAVDLLLTVVFAAAKSNNLALLPGCPFISTAVVLQILNSLPSMASLQKCRYLESTINALGTQAKELLTWVCSAHRGFLASATGMLKIPSLPPGTQQFVLANASPEKESAFLAHINQDPTTRLLFHGTTPDRLFSILCQGLQIKSNTPLQLHGAASGAGIYMAEDPRTSWSYTGQGLVQGNWQQSTLTGFKVLLGCENAGPSVGNSSMHVIRDPNTVMVRYVFLIPTTVTTLPVNIRTHIDTAVLAVFRGLRSGAY